jgi:hypothetical protein
MLKEANCLLLISSKPPLVSNLPFGFKWCFAYFKIDFVYFKVSLVDFKPASLGFKLASGNLCHDIGLCDLKHVSQIDSDVISIGSAQFERV